MAVGQREGNTMAEGCRKLMSTLTDMKLEPDADDDFINAMEQAIIGYLRNPTPQEQAQQQAVGGPMGQAMGSVMQGSPQASGAGPMGVGAGAPNADELRRILQPR